MVVGGDVDDVQRLPALPLHLLHRQVNAGPARNSFSSTNIFDLNLSDSSRPSSMSKVRWAAGSSDSWSKSLVELKLEKEQSEEASEFS